MDGMGETGYPQQQLAAIFWVEDFPHKFPVARRGPCWLVDRRVDFGSNHAVNYQSLPPLIWTQCVQMSDFTWPLCLLSSHYLTWTIKTRLRLLGVYIKKGNARVNVTGYPGSSSLPLCLDLIWLCGMLIHSFVFYCVDSIILVLLSITWLDNAINAYHIVMTHHQCSCIQHIFIWILFMWKRTMCSFNINFHPMGSGKSESSSPSDRAIGKMLGVFGMVPLIMNPIYTLYSGCLLGISPFKNEIGSSRFFLGGTSGFRR